MGLHLGQVWHGQGAAIHMVMRKGWYAWLIPVEGESLPAVILSWPSPSP